MGKKTHGPYLIAAIEYNDIEKVSEILVKQFRNKSAVSSLLVSEIPRLASEYTEIPLLLAANLPDPTILKYFVTKHNVNINHVFESGTPKHQRKTTALLVAVRRNLYETVNCMLALNADPNIADHRGRRPLHHALRRADYRMTKMLLTHGAQSNLADSVGNTPLHVATIYGHMELVKLLLQHQGDVYKKGQRGALAIHMAAHEGHANLVRLFCQFSEVNPNIKVPCYDDKEKSPLHVAAERGHSETVFTLLEHCGAAVDIRDSEGETPLHSAVIHEYDPSSMKTKEDHTETVKLLLNYGANANARNARGETPLHLATRNEYQKVVEVLILAGSDPSAIDNDNNKPLDLTSDDDTVSRQTLLHAIENRERYMSESLEVRARGFSTSTQREATLPLSVQSSSLHGMPMLLGAAPGLRTLTRASSSPGLFASPPQSALVASTYSLLNRSGCTTPVGSASQIPALTHLQLQQHLSSEQMSLASTCPSVIMDGRGGIYGLPPRLSGRQKSLPNGSAIRSNCTTPTLPPAAHHRPPPSEVSDLNSSMQSISPPEDDASSTVSSVPSSLSYRNPLKFTCPSENSSVWDVTPAPSVVDSSLDVRMTNGGRQQQFKAKRKVIQQKIGIAPKPSVPTRAKPSPSPLVFVRADSTQPDIDVVTSDEESDVDERSFDNVSQSTVKAPAVSVSNRERRPSANDWLQCDQSDVSSKACKSHSVSSEASDVQSIISEISSVSSSATAPVRPPKVSRTSPSAPAPPPVAPEVVAGGAKRRPPPPVPEKKSSKARETASGKHEQKIVEIEVVDAQVQGQTAVRVVPLSPPGMARTQVLPSKVAQEIIDTLEDDSVVERLLQSSISSADVSGKLSQLFSAANSSSLKRLRLVRKVKSDGKQGRLVYWEITQLQSPGGNDARNDRESNESGVRKKNTLENQIQHTSAKQMIAQQQQPKQKLNKSNDFIEESLSDISEISSEETDGHQRQSNRPLIAAKVRPFEDTLRNPGGGHGVELGPLVSPTSPVSGYSFDKAQLPSYVHGGKLTDSIDDEYLYQRSLAGLTATSEDNIIAGIDTSSYVTAQLANGSSQIYDVAALAAPSHPRLSRSFSAGCRSPPPPQSSSYDMMQVELQRQHEMELLELHQKQQQQQQLLAAQLVRQQHEQQQQQQLLAELARQQQQQAMLQHLQLQQQAIAETKAIERRHSTKRERTNNSRPNSSRSSQAYDDIPEESDGGKRISLISDEFILQYGKNVRKITFNSKDKVFGFSVCGGNISGTFVNALKPDSPAVKAGLKVGDQIVGVNGKLVKNLSKEDIFLMIQRCAGETLSLVVVRDDDRFSIASAKNAVGDSFFVQAHFGYVPQVKKGELAVKEGDIFQVTDTMPEERLGYWMVKKVTGTLEEPEGYVPNRQKAEQIVAAQKLAGQSDPALAKQRGGAFMRSFRRSKSTDRQGHSQDSDSRRSSESGDILTYERVIQRKPPIRRPVVLLGLFCDAVCAMLAKDSPGLYEAPSVAVEKCSQSSEDFTSDSINIELVRSIVNRGKHCLMVVSPKAIQFIRETTELRPIVIYLSPVSKSVVKAVKERLAPDFDKKTGVMIEEAAKFEKLHCNLFDAMVPYKTDSTWFGLLKDAIERLQRQPQWVAFEVAIPELDGGGAPASVLRSSKRSPKHQDPSKRISLTTDDLPDQLHDALSQQGVVDTTSPVDDGSEQREDDERRSPSRHSKKSSSSSRKHMHNRSLASIDYQVSAFQTTESKSRHREDSRRANDTASKVAVIHHYDASPRKPLRGWSHTNSYESVFFYVTYQTIEISDCFRLMFLFEGSNRSSTKVGSVAIAFISRFRSTI